MITEQTYIERSAPAALAQQVSSVWIQHVPAGGEPLTHRNIPSGAVELVSRGGEMPRVVGPLTAPLVEVLEPGTTVVGLRLHPAAASAVLGLPASELVDLTVDLDELAGDPPPPEAGLAGLERFVADRIAPPDPLVAELVRQLRWRTDDVGSLTSELYISERQLRRRCEAAVGLSPKALHRILRFQGFLALAQHAIAHGRAPTDEGIALLAAEAGYADQSHLSRECLRLTGASPRAFLGEAEHTCACGHDHSASFAPVLRARPAL
jgi:AraC-like DNA-binding protein